MNNNCHENENRWRNHDCPGRPEFPRQPIFCLGPTGPTATY